MVGHLLATLATKKGKVVIKFWLIVFTSAYFNAVGPYETETACKAAKAVLEEVNNWDVDMACTPTPTIPLKPPQMQQTVPVPPAPESKK